MTERKPFELPQSITQILDPWVARMVAAEQQHSLAKGALNDILSAYSKDYADGIYYYDTNTKRLVPTEPHPDLPVQWQKTVEED